jgi:protoporphyrinogen oxidase
MFFETYTEKLWGRHPASISAEWGAQRVKGLSIAAVLKDIFYKMLPFKRSPGKVETSLIEEFSYPKYGPGQLWETAADRFQKMGGKLILNCKVTSFARDEKGNIISVTGEKQGEFVEFAAHKVLSSMPVKDLIAALPQVPENVAEIAGELPYRDFVTVGLVVGKIKLRNRTKLSTVNNIVPDCWIYVQDTGVKLGRIQIFNNWSPYLVKEENTISLGLEYFCREGDEYWKMSREEWVAFAHGELVKMGVLDENEPILSSHVEKVVKAYPAYFGSYQNMDKILAFCDSISNLYCIGRNGQHRYNNMDHSMATGFAAAEHILAGGKTGKEAVWKVNTEKEYHEEKK